MPLTALADAKQHLRVDFTDDDNYISDLCSAAEVYIQTIGVSFGTDEQTLPNFAVQQAILLLVGYWYENRCAAGAKPSTPIAFGLNALLAPYREISF